MPAIGQWVRRLHMGREIKHVSKAHFTESVIADAAITTCGRRMEPYDLNGNPLELMNFRPVGEDICYNCSKIH